MDPITLIAGATAAYNGLKSAIAAGKEIQEMAQDLGNLWNAVGQLTHLASTPVKKGLFSNPADIEKQAMERYAAKAKAFKMQEEIKNLFISIYGVGAYESVQREVIEIRKEVDRAHREEERLAAERAAELKDAAGLFLIVMGLISSIAVIGILFMIKLSH
jgi:uncharacterized protein (UPF0335 family)